MINRVSLLHFFLKNLKSSLPSEASGEIIEIFFVTDNSYFIHHHHFFLGSYSVYSPGPPLSPSGYW